MNITKLHGGSWIIYSNPLKYVDLNSETATRILEVGMGIAGEVAVYDWATAEKSEEKEKSIPIAETRKKNSSTTIYRTGSGNATNSTPREDDIGGLSHFLRQLYLQKQMEGLVMSQIDELLKLEPYDIYNNELLEIQKINDLGICLSKENVDFSNYFRLNKFSSKFCWKNLILVIEKIEYPQKLKGIPCLFEILKDVNWPVFYDAVDLLQSFDKKDIVPFMKKYLRQAYLEQDEMWIAGIYILAEKMNIISVDFQNKETYDLFQYRDF